MKKNETKQKRKNTQTKNQFITKQKQTKNQKKNQISMCKTG